MDKAVRYTLRSGCFACCCDIVTQLLLFMPAIKAQEAVAVLPWMIGVAPQTIAPHKRWYRKRGSQNWKETCTAFYQQNQHLPLYICASLSFCSGISIKVAVEINTVVDLLSKSCCSSCGTMCQVTKSRCMFGKSATGIVMWDQNRHVTTHDGGARRA